MAYSNPGNPGPAMADEDYFSDGPKSDPEDMQKEGSEETALIPKSLLSGTDFKPGDEIVFQIKAIHEKDVMIAYAPEKGKEEEAEGPHDEGGEMAGMEGGTGGGGGG